MMTDHWNPHYSARSPMLQQFVHQLVSTPSWPSITALNEAGPEGVYNQQGMPIRLIDQSGLQGNYEVSIYETGQLPTRTENWHDFFNAHVWFNYPKTKAMINALQYQSLVSRHSPQRSPIENAMTLFDENGAIVVSSDPKIFDLLRNHQWQELFVEQRAHWRATTQVLIIGHSLHEKALAPYIGMTAQCLMMPHPNPLQPLRQLIPDVDAWCQATLLAQRTLLSPKTLQPLPLLGVPGWHDEPQNREFYANTEVFRVKRVVS